MNPLGKIPHHLCDGPLKAEKDGSEGQKALNPPHLSLGSQGKRKGHYTDVVTS